MTKLLYQIADKFLLEGQTISVEPYGEGHINHTYLVTTDKKRYIMQEMNTRVFPHYADLMSNICATTEHLQSKGVETLEVIPLRTGEKYLNNNGVYRMYKFIENTVTYQTVENNTVFEASGKAFGEFQNQLSDFDASVLYEVIPNFHNTPKRFEAFINALEKDEFQRAVKCGPEIAFVLDHKDTLSKIVDGISDGTIPLRVTHNDTKLNNILMDEKTDKARAIIDLDTIMPGCMLYDFGDSIRFGSSTAAEDEMDLEKVHFSIEKFEAYSKGFCNAVKDTITAKEIELLPYSAYLLTIECGIRFLTDYLEGNVYFATKYEDHNLIRCRTQFKLAHEIEENFERCTEIVASILQ